MSETEKRQAGAEVSLKLLWSRAAEAPITFANQFVVQISPEGAFLTVGHAAPPILLGTADEQTAQAGQLSDLEVPVAGKYYLPFQALVDLARIINDAVKNIPVAT